MGMKMKIKENERERIKKENQIYREIQSENKIVIIRLIKQER